MNPIQFNEGAKAVDRFTGETVTILKHESWYTDIQYPNHIMRLNSCNNPRYIEYKPIQLALF